LRFERLLNGYGGSSTNISIALLKAEDGSLCNTCSGR
jgi:hypothetical protein